MTVAGDLQSELGCANDWMPDCAATHLAFDPVDDVWQGTFDVPAGGYQYKAALNNSWTENYGDHAQNNGGNLSLNLGAAASVKFYYSHQTHWITSNKNAVIAVAPGSFQHFLGCAGDWQPDCLRSWLQDPDGDGIYTFTTRSIPAGSYETKVAINESWDENYGAGGASNGANIPFTVASDCAETVFSYNAATHVLTIAAGSGGGAAQPASVTIPGSFQSELGCPDDWQPGCANTHLAYDSTDGVWQGTFNIPAGSYEYKAALNDSWDVNYGANAQPGGGNIGLTLASPSAVKFYYDDATHWVTSNKNAVIATAPGSYQHFLGCSGDWQPDCLRSWLQDPDGDGVYTFSTTAIPPGNYETKVAINESWDENYGANGALNGANISFSVPQACVEIFFSYNSTTHVLTVGANGAPKGNIGRAQAYWVTRGHHRLEPGRRLSLVERLPPLRRRRRPRPRSRRRHRRHLDPADLGPGRPLRRGPGEVPAHRRLLGVPRPGEPPRRSARGPQGADRGRRQGRRRQPGGRHRPPDPGRSRRPLHLQRPAGRHLRRRPRADPAGLGADRPRRQAPPVRRLQPGHRLDRRRHDGRSGDRRLERHRARGLVRQVLPLRGGRLRPRHRPGRDQPGHRPLLGEPVAQQPAQPDRRPRRSGLQAGRLGRPASSRGSTLPRTSSSTSSTSATSAPTTPACPPTSRGPSRRSPSRFSLGMLHLRSLSLAGLTHVHLLPSFDIASINEDKSQWQQPAGDLSSFPPDSQEQQARVRAVGGRRPLQLGLRPLALHRARGELLHQPGRTGAHPRVPPDGQGARATAACAW